MAAGDEPSASTSAPVVGHNASASESKPDSATTSGAATPDQKSGNNRGGKKRGERGRAEQR